MDSSVGGYISVNEAAERLGIKPQEVARLIARGDLADVVLVSEESLIGYQEQR